LIATAAIRSPAPEMIHEERPWVEDVPCLFTFADRYCHFYVLCLLRQIVLAADSQQLFSSPQRAHVKICQAWQTWACVLAFMQHACCLAGASRWSGGQIYLLLPFFRSQNRRCNRVFQPPDRQCSHLGPLALFCTAATLLTASCLFRSENWLLASFLLPPTTIVSFASMGFFWSFKCFPSINLPASGHRPAH